MADYERLLQAMLGSTPNPLMDADARMRPSAPNALAPYAAPAMDNPFVTPGDQQRERISTAFGWDVGRPWQELGRRAMTYLPMVFPGRSTVGARVGNDAARPARSVAPQDFEITHPIQDRNLWRVDAPNGAGGVEGMAAPDIGVFRVNMSSLDREMRGRGVGMAMYRRLIDEAHRRGYTVQSDVAVSPAAQRVYNGLSARGYEVTQSPHAKQNKFGELWGSDTDPVFVVRPGFMTPIPVIPGGRND